MKNVVADITEFVRSISDRLKLVRKMAFKGLAIAGGLFALAQVPIAFAAPSESLTFTIRPLDTSPPAAITDLQAIPGAAGQMLLQWTAPDENNNIFANKDPATSYLVRIASFSADSVGGAAVWWTRATFVSGEPTPSQPGLTEYFLINGLLGDVTYYIGIRSIDDDNQISPIDTRATTPGQQAFAYVSATNDAPPNNFVGIALSTMSIRWTWDPRLGASFYTLNAYPSGTLITQTTLFTVTETNLGPNAPISRTLRSGSINGLSAPTLAQTVYTLAATPSNFSATNVGFTSVTLGWSTGGNPAGTQYRLERSLDGSSYVSVTLLTGLSYSDTGLTELTSYYYRIRGLNGDGLITAPSPVVSVFTPKQVDFITPATPAGLKGSLDASRLAFTLTWEAVTKNSDGTTINDLVGYNIYRRLSLAGAGVKVTPTPLTATAFADSVNGQTYYYTIRAIDTTGNESPDSLIADSSVDANIIFLGADGVSHVLMPQTVNNLLRSAFNRYNVPLTIQLAEEPLVNDGVVVRNVRLKLLRTDNGEVLNTLAFTAPQATVAVGYNLVNGQVATGAPNSNVTNSGVGGKAITSDQLSLYWFNGVTWVRIGGTLDVPMQTIKTKSSFLGNYQLRASANPSTLTLSQGNVYPRLFTPNGDGLNDRVYFVLENPNNATVSGEILDKEGRHVRTLPPAAVSSGVGTTLNWDGKDDRGNVVPGGAYIYKISGEGHSFSGTIGVAR